MDLLNPKSIDLDTAETLYGIQKGTISELEDALLRFQRRDRVRRKALRQTCLKAKEGNKDAQQEIKTRYGLKVYTSEECRKLQEVSAPPRARRGKRPFVLKNAREER